MAPGRIPSGWSEPSTPVAAGAAGALAGALLAGVLVEQTSRPDTVARAFCALLLGSLLLRRPPRWSHLLPFMRIVVRLAGPALGGLALLVVMRLRIGLGEIGLAEMAAVVTTAAGTSNAVARLLRDRRTVRMAVIGSQHVADMMDRELRLANVRRFEVVGRIATPGAADEPGEVAVLGRLGDLAGIAAEHRISLLLLSSHVPRLLVFDEFAGSCLSQDVRLVELSDFYERSFGHVPVADINSAWFQYLMRPESHTRQGLSGRLVDIALGLALLPAAIPVIGVLALAIRRDGHPPFFGQVRIGEGGRPFVLLKLRTMHVGAGHDWAGSDDARVTPLGRILRRSHLDELPQLLNVLRGEMSIIGPRPEQPEFVARLERLIPHYTRRHILKPGLTGWAQVRCGYGGSDLGSAWKVAHDLFYLKHHSVSLDLLILGETLRLLIADPQYTAEPASVEFILAPAREGQAAPAVEVLGPHGDPGTA